MTYSAPVRQMSGLTRLLIALLLTAFAVTSMAGQIKVESAKDDLALQPSPSLTPQQVVDFQLTALQLATDGGISATFRFASPANRKMTGPLSRFARLFDSPHYQPMLSNRGTEIKLVSNNGYNAEVLAGVVDNAGELLWYRFLLSRQSEAPYKNCWMTDAVLVVPHPGDSA